MCEPGLCASVLRDSGQSPAAGASDASAAASVFAAGVAESCMDMSTLPDGMSPPCARVSAGTIHVLHDQSQKLCYACYILQYCADLKSIHAHLVCILQCVETTQRTGISYSGLLSCKQL